MKKKYVFQVVKKLYMQLNRVLQCFYCNNHSSYYSAVRISRADLAYIAHGISLSLHQESFMIVSYELNEILSAIIYLI